MVFDNRLAPSPRYKRECSNKFVLLNMDCDFFYFDELVTYFVATLNSFVGNWDIKTSNETKEKIVEGLSLRVSTPSRAYIRASPGS